MLEAFQSRHCNAQTFRVMQNYEIAEMIKRSKPESCIWRSSLVDLRQSQLAKATERPNWIVGEHQNGIETDSSFSSPGQANIRIVMTITAMPKICIRVWYPELLESLLFLSMITLLQSLPLCRYPSPSLQVEHRGPPWRHTCLPRWSRWRRRGQSQEAFF